MLNLDIVYGDMNYVRQWSLVDGYPECLNDAIPPSSPDAAQAIQNWQAIVTLITSVMEYENALLVSNTNLEAYTEAQTLISTANSVTINHSLWRTDKPSDIDLLTSWETAGSNVMAEFTTLAYNPIVFDPRPVPQSIALWQAKAVLQSNGLLAGADEAIASANNPVVNAFWANASFTKQLSILYLRYIFSAISVD